MDYADLSKKERQSLNGIVAQYMDAYIRQHRVWTPEQMCMDFMNAKNEEYHSDFLKGLEYSDRKRQILTVLSFILSEEGQQNILERMIRKYKKDNDIAIRESPIAERVRFGLWPNFNYDINYGLKGTSGHDRMTTEELRDIKYTAWTVEHVENELDRKYSKTIRGVYKDLPLNHFEIDFFNYWLTNFYSPNSPALIAYINGLRPTFGYLMYKGIAFNDYSKIGIPFYDPGIQYIRFRYDFMLINVATKRACFIDIIDDEFPTTESEKSIQEVKIFTAKENEFDYIAFTRSDIKSNIDRCFASLKKYLSI